MIFFNPRPPELFFVARPPNWVVAKPALDFLYGTLDTPIFATSVYRVSQKNCNNNK